MLNSEQRAVGSALPHFKEKMSHLLGEVTILVRETAREGIGFEAVQRFVEPSG
jgi:hypothetical protein